MSNGKNDTSALANRLVNSTAIKGEVISEADFRIDGQLEGDLTTSGKVVIGKTGVVIGNVHCDNADVEGELTGSIAVNQLLIIKSSANIKGDIITGKLSVEAGAIVNITCNMQQAQDMSHTLFSEN